MNTIDNNISTIERFSDTLVAIANKTIPKTGTSSHKIKNPWFTEECKKARKLRQKALHTLKAHPTSTNIEQFRITRASYRRIMRQSQRSSWRSYVSKINSNTPSRRIWNMLHKIHGKNTRQPVKHLKVNNSIITDTKEIADTGTLSSTISYNSSSRHYSTNFLLHKTAAEQQDIQFPPADEESYNLPISLSELKNSINAAQSAVVFRHGAAPYPPRW